MQHAICLARDKQYQAAYDTATLAIVQERKGQFYFTRCIINLYFNNFKDAMKDLIYTNDVCRDEYNYIKSKILYLDGQLQEAKLTL